MLWDLLNRDEKALVLLKILIHVSKADKQLSSEEFTYLIQLCSILKLNPELIRTLYLDEGELNEILPTDEQDRINILFHTLLIMDADKHIDPAEEKLIFHFGFKLGFSELMIKDFLDVFHRYDIDDLPPESMLNVIRKYNN
jgi:hypothetical protein